ncbi:type II toxin-antitoxin system ParD family antitoxin [Lacipirellula sp.]|uniref:type II toxin-antitoxin system ParD family antitoxin n=1 Tax=Lacipirellula sp. TaxID=2691419 RepID=UPI003D0A395F
MEISISPEFQQFIEGQLALGAYATPSEVVGDALRLLQLHDREREMLVSDLRQKVAVGLEQIDRGETVAAHDVFEELRRRNAQHQAQSR